MLLVRNAERIFMLLEVDSLNKVKIKKRANLLGIDQWNNQYSSKFSHFYNFHFIFQDIELISRIDPLFSLGRKTEA